MQVINLIFQIKIILYCVASTFETCYLDTKALHHHCQKGYQLYVRNKQDWGQRFMLLLLQSAVLPGSDAGSDVVEPASNFVIQNHQTWCSMCVLCMSIGHTVKTWSSACSLVLYLQSGQRVTLFMLG